MKFIFLFILQIVFIKSFSQDIHSNRVAYYPFNGDAKDQVGNNHGVVHGPQLVKDRFGNPDYAFQFDGVQDFIEIPDNPVFNFDANEDFTISLWVNISENQADLNGHNNEILGKWNAYNYTGYPFAIRYWNRKASSSNKHKMFTMRYDSENCGNNPVITGACTISNNEWHHIVMRKQGSEIAYFQDGILSGTVQDNTNYGCGTRNSNPVFIGKRDRDSRYFTGAIDDISFYNRALTEEEIDILLKENQWSPPNSSFTGIFDSFFFAEQTGPSTIDSLNYTIAAEVPCSSDLSALVAQFSLPDGTYASVNEITQQSGVSANNFTEPVTYLLKDENNCFEQEWTVYVNFNPIRLDAKTLNSEKFFLPNVITPNNDEYNDAFEVGPFFLGSEFSVFNRHGKRVFKSSNYQNEFFGYNLSPGVYFYTINHQCLEKALNGYLFLVKE